MATRNEQVMEMVRQELERQPGIASRELFDRAKQMDPEMENISLQQFHARYPLQVKRRGAGATGGEKGKKPARRGARSAPAAATATAASSGDQTEQGTRQRRGRRRSQGAGQEASRDAVRSIFLRFASDFAQAETRSEIVGVLSNVDGYVDEVVKLSGSS